MMTITFNSYPDNLVDVDEFFDGLYLREWLDDQDVISIVKDVDRSDLIGMNVISPVLGSISIKDISGGAKGLILLLKEDEEDFVIDLCSFGQNCVPWLAEICRRRDITVCMNGIDLRFDGYDFDALCLNDNTITHTGRELDRKKLDYVWEDIL